MKKSLPILEFKQVSKKFGSQRILEEISFKIYPQEFVFLIGPSGAGKTSIFRLLSREILPSNGEIFFDQKTLSDLGICDLRRRIGRVFQDLKLISDRTVFENIQIALDVAGGYQNPTEEIKKVIDWVGLKEKKHLFPAQLAEGEKQRVGIARALISAPEVLLVDEPTSNLDSNNAWKIIKLLKDINKKGATVVIATHDEDILNSLEDRTIILSKEKDENN